MDTGIALDLGSSGFRVQAIDLSSGDILYGAYTTCHPLPGGNVIDHILFALTYGQDLAHNIVIRTIERLTESISKLKDVQIIAVCGNPIQLAIFTNGDLRDLAFCPDSMKRKGIAAPSREARTFDAGALGLGAKCDVLVPPSIKAEVGADAIAMIKKSGLIQKRSAMAVDFGTNAEMALKAGEKLYVGSAAAGPAIEGQHIGCGMLAAPGAICDLEYDWGWKCRVLDERMVPRDGDIVEIAEGRITKKSNMHAIGITGTGVISLVSVGLDAGYIDLPNILTGSRTLSLQDGISFNEMDLLEAGKAFGAIKAGQRTLAAEADISLEEVDICYMAGAAGSCADPYKARDVGLIPIDTRMVKQLGNTSLETAKDLVMGEETLEGMQRIADMAEHVSFSTSEVFKQNFLREYAYWCEGARYSEKGIGPGMRILRTKEKKPQSPIQYSQPKYYIPYSSSRNSNSYRRCISACPKKALIQRESCFELDLKRCLGTSCLRCECACSGFKLGVNRADIREA